MSLCPGCGISYCLDCEKPVEPDIFRCEECQKDHLANDPFVLTTQEQSREIHELKKEARFVYDVLIQLQHVVRGSFSEAIRDDAYHAVIDLRNFVKQEMLDGGP